MLQPNSQCNNFSIFCIFLEYIPHNLPGISVWIGGSDKTTESSWGWIDSSQFTYVNWNGLLKQSSSFIQCLAMNVEAKNWVPTNCNFTKAYMCKKPSKLLIHISVSAL